MRDPFFRFYLVCWGLHVLPTFFFDRFGAGSGFCSRLLLPASALALVSVSVPVLTPTPTPVQHLFVSGLVLYRLPALPNSSSSSLFLFLSSYSSQSLFPVSVSVSSQSQSQSQSSMAQVVMRSPAYKERLRWGIRPGFYRSESAIFVRKWPDGRFYRSDGV